LKGITTAADVKQVKTGESESFGGDISITKSQFHKLRQLTIPPNVLLWIINFLSGRTEAVSSLGQISGWLPVSRSIIQGSGIGPYLYLVYASDLRTLSPHNVIIKYAGEALLVGQHSSVD